MITKIIDGNEENVSGGSAGGGHVIKNQSGTDMAQRANLQFIDATLADDSTNNRTKVELLKELANASDLASQPDGLYLVEDSTPMPGISANIVSYSNTTSGLTADDVQDAVDELASGKISKSQTSGFIKNDGTVDTTSYVNKSGDVMTGDLAINKASADLAIRASGTRFSHLKSSASGADHTNYLPNQDGTLVIQSQVTDIQSGIIGGNEWVSGTSYVIGDIVTYDSIVYRCITANSGTSAPSTRADRWEVTSFKTICPIINRDREFIYAQRDQNITITFSGSAVTRVSAGFLIVSGQSGIIEPISFMFSGMGSYPTRESINNATVYLSANGYNITGGVQCINIPAGLGNDWGYIMIKEIGDALKDITITVTYS